jgi:hypothetical protein
MRERSPRDAFGRYAPARIARDEATGLLGYRKDVSE